VPKRVLHVVSRGTIRACASAEPDTVHDGNQNGAEMTNRELYVRVLTELHDSNTPAHRVRLNLQDVLIELRNRAAAESGDQLGQETQDSAEAEAARIVRHRKRWRWDARGIV
jgi:hypothetical protein